MKLSKLTRIALVSVAAATCCVGLRAYQRVADFGFGNDDSPSNVKAEFYWARLAYSANMQSFSGGYGGRGYGGRQSWSRDVPQADRQFSERMLWVHPLSGDP